ncbi:flagellar biosynthesis regulatory protein FlaF [Geobacter sp. OR-1]|uniref:flagellar biosynthesis regulator FlaF n=1 Tax=Geobacter sp. OR-1 TaxID=1266765 RepID=UPI00054393F0|nr:flagellar biosynthesis regulator FlaF [Geobacter sp. OR-1]GAM09659.1 flagellar biosynthesis regulatory protein FlaF [Geobacter sp. OR-1]
MQQAGVNAYMAMQKEGLSGRDLEAAVLNRAANMLRECQEKWGQEGFEALLDQAVTFNQRIWSFFQGELSSPDNPLPREIRENILSLSVFVDSRLIDVLMNPAPELLNVVISINQNLAAGLMQKTKQDDAQDQAVNPGELVVSA